MAWDLSLPFFQNTTTAKAIRKLAQRIEPSLETRDSVTALSVATATVLLWAVWYWGRTAPLLTTSTNGTAKSLASGRQPEGHDPNATDPDLLRDNSEIKSFQTRRFTYPRVRVFFKPHTRLDELPKDPAPLPLLVFVHGLGGSVAQFHALLASLTHNSSCLAVDLPGCGISELAPKDWAAYTNEALVELLETIIDRYRDKNAGQGIVLIGHSMGCALSARLASPGSSKLAEHVMGLVGICPPAGPPTESQVKTFRKLLCIPGTVFDLWRKWDARGGAESASVRRFVGADADAQSKRLQFRYNRQSRTQTWRRMAWGSLPVYENGVPKGGIAGPDVWATLRAPVFLIAGGQDHLTPAKEVEKIAGCLSSHTSNLPHNIASNSHQPIVDAAAPFDISAATPKVNERITDISEADFHREKKTHVPSTDSDDDAHEDPTTPHEPATVGMPAQPSHPDQTVKTVVLPRGTHAMIYTPDCSHILASIIADFLSQHVTGRLSRSWQLQYLNKEGKWELKNLAKWQGVEPVSKPIAGVFRAMKTMREVDDQHSPARFVEKWGHIVKDIIDISKDTPVYDPAGLERVGIRYHKFPTVSKIPPTDEEVDSFVALVDRLRKEQETRAVEEGWGTGEHAVGVHCHYGYNRTGYFIVCYLVERCGYGVQQAIDAFALARPKGIRHSHFRDQLFVRYSELRTTA